MCTHPSKRHIFVRMRRGPETAIEACISCSHRIFGVSERVAAAPVRRMVVGPGALGLVRSGMSYALIDDAIWARLAPLIPPRRLKRGHRHGRTPIPDRAILTGILFVLRSGIP